MQELGKSNHFFPFKSRIIKSKPQHTLAQTKALAQACCRAPRVLPISRHDHEVMGDPSTEPDPARGSGDGTGEPRTTPGSTGKLSVTYPALHARMPDAEQEDIAGDLGRGKAATARPAGTRGLGHLLPTLPGPVMLCRCSVISVHPGEHRRHWFHQSSGLL